MSIEAENLNPFVTITPCSLHVGGGASDSALLDALLADVDLVVDATGSQVAARVLQRRCREFPLCQARVRRSAGRFYCV